MRQQICSACGGFAGARPDASRTRLVHVCAGPAEDEPQGATSLAPPSLLASGTCELTLRLPKPTHSTAMYACVRRSCKVEWHYCDAPTITLGGLCPGETVHVRVEVRSRRGCRVWQGRHLSTCVGLRERASLTRRLLFLDAALEQCRPTSSALSSTAAWRRRSSPRWRHPRRSRRFAGRRARRRAKPASTGRRAATVARRSSLTNYTSPAQGAASGGWRTTVPLAKRSWRACRPSATRT